MNTPIQTPPTKPNLEISDTLSEAWRLTYGIKWQVFVSQFLIPTIIAVVAGTIIALTTPINYSEAGTPVVSFNPLSIVIVTLAGILVWFSQLLANIIGVRQALGLPVRLKDAMDDCSNSKAELFYIFFYWILVFVGTTFIPFIGGIVYVYLVLPLYIYVIPLVAIKRSDAKFAFNVGFRLLNQNLLVIAILYIIMFILVVISAIPAGIGLIWTLPMMNSMYGSIFRKTYTPAQIAEDFSHPQIPNKP
jgi:uncharacterized membrane protein